mgnify:CR=1 FL=1
MPVQQKWVTQGATSSKCRRSHCTRRRTDASCPVVEPCSGQASCDQTQGTECTLLQRPRAPDDSTTSVKSLSTKKQQQHGFAAPSHHVHVVVVRPQETSDRASYTINSAHGHLYSGAVVEAFLENRQWSTCMCGCNNNTRQSIAVSQPPMSATPQTSQLHSTGSGVL